MTDKQRIIDLEEKVANLARFVRLTMEEHAKLQGCERRDIDDMRYNFNLLMGLDHEELDK